MHKNVSLTIAFLILLAFFGWKKFIASDQSRNYKQVLLELDTTTISKISIVAKSNNLKEIEILKKDNIWEVSNGNITDEADINIVKSMLGNLVRIEPERLAAKSKNKWNQFEVTDSLGTRVNLFSGDKLLSDFIIGKPSFQQSSRKMSTYVRLREDLEVYSVDGMLSPVFDRTFNSFRDKTFLEFEKASITSLNFDYQGDSSFILSKIAGYWKINEEDADSTSVATFLNDLSNLNLNEFADNFSEENRSATYQLKIDGDNINSIIIKAFQNNDEIVLQSSLNDHSYFENGAIDIFNKLFVGTRHFNPKSKNE